VCIGLIIARNIIRRFKMPKYLFQGSYTIDGVKGILNEGGSARRETIAQLAKSMGGSLEAYYFAFGDNDFFVILDLPNNVVAAATSLVGSASGALAVKTTVLLTPEEIDQAAKTTVDYRPPGE
jgi:uncharacterized protein with GYD domain